MDKSPNSYTPEVSDRICTCLHIPYCYSFQLALRWQVCVRFTVKDGVHVNLAGNGLVKKGNYSLLGKMQAVPDDIMS